jgi:ABC-2 type transport system ATP-binding protein
MDNDITITVQKLKKDFILPHEQVTTVKGLFTGFYKRNRSKEVQHALRDISFEIKKGEFFGIIGRNGSGKSTLLKILAGIYQPTAGQVHTDGKLVPFIELGVGFNPELTGRENVYLNGAMLGFSAKEIDARYKKVVEFSELERFMDQKLKNYSSGMQVRLAFAVATQAEADILLVDEVLAVGDADFQSKCFKYFKELKRLKKTVVFVTHDMDAVREYCDRAILIEGGDIQVEGQAEKVSRAYTRMFFEEEKKTQKTKQKRWGNNDVTIEKVTVYPSTVKDADSQVTIEIEIKAHKQVEGPVVGFMLKNQAAQPILGTNSHIEQQELEKMSPGDIYKVSWSIPHVFGRGLYYIDPSVIEGRSTNVYDWWEEAGRFLVHNDKVTPYLINPKVGLKITKAK